MAERIIGILGAWDPRPPSTSLRKSSGKRRLRKARAISGCTEISLVLKEKDLPVPVIDPVSVLTRAAVEMAAGIRKRR